MEFYNLKLPSGFHHKFIFFVKIKKFKLESLADRAIEYAMIAMFFSSLKYKFSIRILGNSVLSCSSKYSS